MSSDVILLSAANKIAQSFDLEFPDNVTLDDIREELVNRIVHMLNGDPEQLMRLLYRIDVKEAAVNEIFDTAFPPDVPVLIANLIIERQLQKAETRRAFAEQQKQENNEGNDSDEKGQETI